MRNVHLAALSITLAACKFGGSPVADPEGDAAPQIDAALDGGGDLDGPAATSCNRAPADDLISQWRLESVPNNDDSGRQFFVGTGAPLATIGGPLASCGGAVEFPTNPVATGHGIIAPDNAWIGAVAFELWVKAPVGPGKRDAIIGRDTQNAEDGHFLIAFVDGDTAAIPLIVVRVQEAPNVTSYSCFARPTDGEWFNLGVNLSAAGFEVWVDGERQPPVTTAFTLFGVGGEVCGNEPPFDFGGGMGLPFLVGMIDPGPGGNQLPFLGGAVDNIRFFSAPQDFGQQ